MPHAPCIYCGEAIEAGDKFCEHCGKAQIRANAPPATIAAPPPIAPPATVPAGQPAPEKGSGGRCGCILALILVIGLAASIGLCKQRQQKQKPPPPPPANNGIAIPVPYGHDGVLTPPRASPGKY
ncbi:MAG TPA: hypothetical protein VNP98_15505 [Chthoniobacterales bacterium]|nr:hypothetical protein [Chthoniobacterales bacterium]